jgi:hypothetical protein
LFAPSVSPQCVVEVKDGSSHERALATRLSHQFGLPHCVVVTVAGEAELSVCVHMQIASFFTVPSVPPVLLFSVSHSG